LAQQFSLDPSEKKNVVSPSFSAEIFRPVPEDLMNKQRVSIDLLEDKRKRRLCSGMGC
jgi:hypothetical protein